MSPPVEDGHPEYPPMGSSQAPTLTDINSHQPLAHPSRDSNLSTTSQMLAEQAPTPISEC